MVDLNKDTLNMGEWRNLPFSEAVLINPTVRLERGIVYPFVDMAAVHPSSRWVYANKQRKYAGGGSRFQGGDTLMARITPCLENGKIARYRSTDTITTAYGSTEFIVIRGRPNITDTGFAYYLTRWSEVRTYAISQMTGTSGRQRVPTSALDHVYVPIPPLPEQRAIAHILGTFDDKIELNRRMNETLEGMARAIFQSWFVDFDPVRAKMDGSWRRGESLPGMPADMYDLYPERLVDSELGEIPEGWEVKMLGDLSHKPQYGYTASAKNESVGPKFLRITDINKKAWIEWGAVPYCEITDKDFDKYRLYKDDILIARMADPGHGVMIEEDQEAVFASYLIRFRPKYKGYARFLQYWLRSNGYWELVRGRGIGTTRASLNAKILSEFPLIVPFHSVILEFAQQIEVLRARVVANTLEMQTLSGMRDTLLPKLISGELRVRDAEGFMESVV